MLSAIVAVGVSALLLPTALRDVVNSITWAQPPPSPDVQLSTVTPLTVAAVAVLAAALSSLIFSVVVRDASATLRLATAIGIGVALTIWSLMVWPSAATASAVFLGGTVAAFISVWCVPAIGHLIERSRRSFS